MAKNILTRVLQTLVVLIGVAFLIFVMLRIVPGNAVTTMMGEHVNAEAVERMTRELGLDQPVPVQFWRYLTGALRGDFGKGDKKAACRAADCFPAEENRHARCARRSLSRSAARRRQKGRGNAALTGSLCSIC